MRWRTTVHRLRIVASFALLGAVVAGITLGWMDHNSADYIRAAGAAVGAIAGIGATVRHAIT